METRCPECGAETPPGEEWKQKICPACLMKLGLSGAISAGPLPEAEGPTRRLRFSIRRSWRWAAFLTGGAAMWAVVLIAVRHFTEKPAPPGIIQFLIDDLNGMSIRDFAVSPDGRLLAYTAGPVGGDALLWVRRLDQLEPRELEGTADAAMPFWSPDSQWIGFFAKNKLKTIRISGGPPVNIANAFQPAGGTWSANGGVLFATSTGLHRVPSTGGEVTMIAAIESGERSLHFQSPQFLPDGVHFLFSAEGRESVREIRLGRLDNGETRRLLQNASGAVHANGKILFVRDGFLLVQPFDLNRAEPTHDPVPIHYPDNTRSADNRKLSLSVGGNVLAYGSARTPVMEELLWMDSRGEVIASATGPAEPSGFALSPDGAAVVVARRSEGVEASELWILDLARRAPMRLTFDNRDAENPLWAPDGRRIVFTSRGESETEIRSIAPNAAKSETLLRSPSGVILDSWSPDSRFLAYTTSQKGKLGLWVLHLEDDRKAMLFLNGEFNYRQGRFSPDGRFMAYVSDESGRDEVYLRSFPSGEVRVLVSVDGGMQPLWRRDGRALVYLSPDQQLKSVDIERSGDRPTPGIPRPMFKMPRAASKYAMTNDGRRFLVALPVQEQERSPIHLVLNWVIITGSDYSNPKF